MEAVSTGVKYRASWASPMRDKRVYEVDIIEDGYIGEPKEMKLTGDGIVITYGNRDASELSSIKSSDCELTVLCDALDAPYLKLYSEDPMKYRLAVYEVTGGERVVIWRGYLSTGEYSQPLAKPPYTVNLRANDGLGLLQSIPYLDENNRKHKGKIRINDLLVELLSPISIGLGITIWQYPQIKSGQTENTLSLIGLGQSTIYSKLGDTPSYYDVLEGVLSTLSLQVFQSGGYYVVRSLERVATAAYNGVLPVIDLDSIEDGYGMSSAGTLSILPSIGQMTIEDSSNNGDEIAHEVLDVDRWYKSTTINGTNYSGVSAYNEDTLRVRLTNSGGYLLKDTLTCVLPEIHYRSASTRLSLSLSVANGLTRDVTIYAGVVLVDADITDENFISYKYAGTPGDYYTIFSANVAVLMRNGDESFRWLQYAEGIENTALSWETLGLQKVTLKGSKVIASRPAVDSLTSTDVTFELPEIPKVTYAGAGNINIEVKRWRLAVILAGPRGADHNTIYLSRPTLKIEGAQAQDGQSLTIAAKGIAEELYSPMWRVGASKSNTPGIIDLDNNRELYGFLSPLGITGEALARSILRSYRSAPAYQLEGVMDKRAHISLNSVAKYQDRYYYPTYIKHYLRRGVYDVQLRECLALDYEISQSVIASENLPSDGIFIAVGDTALFWRTQSNTLRYLDVATNQQRYICDVSLLSKVTEGVGCVVVASVQGSVGRAVAYGERGELLSEITQDTSDGIGAVVWRTNIRYDALNKVWVTTNGAGKIVMYDSAGYITHEWNLPGVQSGKILLYDDGIIHITYLNGAVSQEWHSYTIHGEGVFEVLSGYDEVVKINNSLVVTSDDRNGDKVHIRRGLSLEDHEVVAVPSGYTEVVSINGCAVLLKTTTQTAVYDLRDGNIRRLSGRPCALCGERVAILTALSNFNTMQIRRLFEKINTL